VKSFNVFKYFNFEFSFKSTHGTVGVVDNLFVIIVFALFVKIKDKVCIRDILQLVSDQIKYIGCRYMIPVILTV